MRRLVGALASCDLSQRTPGARLVESILRRTLRQVAAGQSGDKAPHSKEVAYFKGIYLAAGDGAAAEGGGASDGHERFGGAFGRHVEIGQFIGM